MHLLAKRKIIYRRRSEIRKILKHIKL